MMRDSSARSTSTSVVFGGVLAAFSVLPLVGCGDDPSSPSLAPAAGGAGGEGHGCGGGDCAGTPGGGEGACEPTTCSAEGKNCGTISDGCGGELDCGICDRGEACGAVSPNVCGCEEPTVAVTEAKTARRARSGGFSGTSDEYSELHDLVCEQVEDCLAACLDRNGTEPMCAASQCLENSMGNSDCLPAPVWSNLESIQFASSVLSETVQLTVVSTPYNDPLLVDEFKLEVPDAAQIVGITVEINKAGSDVVDDSVRLMKGGVTIGGERASDEMWSEELGWVSYGGPTDLWGEQWTPADLVADEFGVSLSVLYTRTVGNTRAYVDQVRVTVHYSLGCES